MALFKSSKSCDTLPLFYFSDESKSIGKFEYLKRSVDVTLRLLRLEPELVPVNLLYSVVDFSVANRCDQFNIHYTIANSKVK